MIANEGSDQRSKLLPLHTRPGFCWMEWKAYLFIFAMTITLGRKPY